MDHSTTRGDKAMTQPASADEERISWFPVPSEDRLPDNLRKLFNKAKEKIGFTPNVFSVYSFRPERLSAWFAHYKQLHEPTENLNAAEREMIAVKLTRTPTDCSRQDVEHLKSLGLTQEEVWDVIEIAAMYNFTNRMASATGMIPNREYHALAR